jgi:hypothetical protein
VRTLSPFLDRIGDLLYAFDTAAEGVDRIYIFCEDVLQIVELLVVKCEAVSCDGVLYSDVVNGIALHRPQAVLEAMLEFLQSSLETRLRGAVECLALTSHPTVSNFILTHRLS